MFFLTFLIVSYFFLVYLWLFELSLYFHNTTIVIQADPYKTKKFRIMVDKRTECIKVKFCFALFCLLWCLLKSYTKQRCRVTKRLEWYLRSCGAVL